MGMHCTVSLYMENILGVPLNILSSVYTCILKCGACISEWPFHSLRQHDKTTTTKYRSVQSTNLSNRNNIGEQFHPVRHQEINNVQSTVFIWL